MQASAESSNERRFFGFKSPRAINTLRVFGVIDLVCAIPLTIAGAGSWIAVVVTASGRGGLFEIVKFALILTVCGPLILWSGLLMLYRRVVLTPTRLTSGGSLRVVRSCSPRDVLAIDIRQDNFGRAPRAVPFAVLRDGSTLPLIPLSTLVARGGRQLEAQRPVVDDLRQALRVGGSNLAEADMQWSAAQRKRINP